MYFTFVITLVKLYNGKFTSCINFCKLSNMLMVCNY